MKWPAGTGAKGNDGVAATVKNTRGAIGYVESAYAIQNKLTGTQIRNKAGHFVKPNPETFIAAASNANWAGAQNFVVDLIDQMGDKSWPVVSATFVLLPKDPKDPVRSANVTKFLDWAYSNGSPIAAQLEYTPLPKAVQDAARSAWATQIKH